LFGAQRKWRYYWKYRFEIWALFAFSPTVVNPHGFVGSQEFLVENDRAASQHFWLAVIAASVQERVPCDLRDSECFCLRLSDFFFNGLWADEKSGRGYPWVELAHDRPVSCVVQGQCEKHGQRGLSRAAIAIEEDDVHGDSGGNEGGVVRGSFGIGSRGQSGTSSFSRTNSFR
jgi:hypothetical protein